MLAVLFAYSTYEVYFFLWYKKKEGGPSYALMYVD